MFLLSYLSTSRTDAVFTDMFEIFMEITMKMKDRITITNR